MTSRTTVAGAPVTDGGFRPGERRLSEGAGHPPGTGLGGEGYGFLDFSLIISPSTANLPYP